jgi:hypothetical protein
MRELGEEAISTHQVISCGLSFDEAMDLEEICVSDLSLYPRGLNMIPGGHAGIRYLAKFGFQTTRKDWENREKLVRQFGAHCGRAGKPNPLAAARWMNGDYAASVICGNPNNFTLEQVREARYLESLGWNELHLAERFDCSVERVQRLLKGETYSRVN